MSATQFAKDQLKSFIERVEKLEDEKKTISDDIRSVYAEAKANGFDTKALRQIIKLRNQDADERREHEAILEIYMDALGMLATTDLGQAALARKQQELKTEGRRAVTAARPDDKIADPIPIPVHQPVAQVGTQAGIRSALPDGPRPDGAERPHSDSMPFRPASDASAPPASPPDLGGADDFLGIPAFLRRTADNGVPA